MCVTEKVLNVYVPIACQALVPPVGPGAQAFPHQGRGNLSIAQGWHLHFDNQQRR